MIFRKPKDDLELYPQPKVKRLNRLAVLLVALAALVVLWTVYFVLSGRRPTVGSETGPPKAVLETGRVALEQLERTALEPPRNPLESLFGPSRKTLTPPPPRPSRPRPRTAGTTAPRPSDAALRLERARDADVLVAGFGTSASPRGRGDSLDAGGLVASNELELLQSRLENYQPSLETESARQLDAPQETVAKFRTPTSPFVLHEGSLIPAILVTGINSDLPGPAQALVRRNVYDSVSGRHLLIPQGSKLVGSYDHRVVWGQKRVLLSWTRVLFPDGSSLDLGGMPGADLAANAGFHDKVNNHFVRTFGSALLLSAISAGVQLSQPQESFDGGAASARQIAAAALGQELGRATSEITQRSASQQPTLTIRPGYLFHIVATSDLELPGPWQDDLR